MHEGKNIIQRPLYLDRVIPFIGKNLIKVFTGQRRVGKSYFLYQLMGYITAEDRDAHIISINKEDLSFSHIKNADDLHGYVKSNMRTSANNYVFIDEIQDIENFPMALRSLMLIDNVELFCTGSNANLLSTDVVGNLSGRYIEIQIYSLTYTEFLIFHSLKDSDDALDKYLKYGGLPYLKHLPLNDEIIFEYLKNIYSSVIYRDVINRYSIRNSGFLEQLVLFLAQHTGSLFSAKKISDYLKSQGIKVSSLQVQRYLEYLKNAFLVHKVPRYDIKGKRMFEFGEKIYFENIGIRNGIWGYRLEDKGKILENAVYNHLLTKNFKLSVGKIGHNEIDFVAEKQGETNYYQVSLRLTETKTINRELGNLEKIENNYPKTLVTFDKYTGASHGGIQIINIRDFLSDL
ncbi:MAG: ATP-binding protein [Bacteroidales bacterium]